MIAYDFAARIIVSPIKGESIYIEFRAETLSSNASIEVKIGHWAKDGFVLKASRTIRNPEEIFRLAQAVEEKDKRNKGSSSEELSPMQQILATAKKLPPDQRFSREQSPTLSEELALGRTVQGITSPLGPYSKAKHSVLQQYTGAYASEVDNPQSLSPEQFLELMGKIENEQLSLCQLERLLKAGHILNKQLREHLLTLKEELATDGLPEQLLKTKKEEIETTTRLLDSLGGKLSASYSVFESLKFLTTLAKATTPQILIGAFLHHPNQLRVVPPESIWDAIMESPAGEANAVRIAELRERVPLIEPKRVVEILEKEATEATAIQTRQEAIPDTSPWKTAATAAPVTTPPAASSRDEVGRLIQNAWERGTVSPTVVVKFMRENSPNYATFRSYLARLSFFIDEKRNNNMSVRTATYWQTENKIYSWEIALEKGRQRLQTLYHGLNELARTDDLAKIRNLLVSLKTTKDGSIAFDDATLYSVLLKNPSIKYYGMEERLQLAQARGVSPVEFIQQIRIDIQTYQQHLRSPINCDEL